MKWLACILFSILATLIGVEGQENCTYKECSQLLNNLQTLTQFSIEYCNKHNQTYTCVGAELNQCGINNSEIAFAIIQAWTSLPECDEVNPTSTVTPTVIVTPTPGIDCSFTECNNLFHALNINDTSYCYQRMGVYNCLNSTLNACPNGNILNHDVIKEELDNLPSSSCRCVRCDDVYNALVARTPTDDDYCELHKQVDECTRRIIVSCNTNEALFWHAVLISNYLEELPDCNSTQPPPSCVLQPVCLNGVYNCKPFIELNNDLPNFTDKNSNCDVLSEQNFYYCGVYSYSHLRAFNSDYVYTCSSPGLWALFNHPSLKITALNSVPNLSGPYTVVDELNVVIPASNCSQEKIYHAYTTADYLPTTFKDGTHGMNGLELILNSNGTSAYIRIPWINTIIVVHKLANHIGIAIQSPESVANRSVGLCSLGCPEHSKLTVQEVVTHNLAGSCSREAYATCHVNNFTLLEGETQGEYYFEKCLFDTLTTNNTNSSWISLAMVDSWHLLKNSTTIYSTMIPSPEYENQQFTGNNANNSGSTLCYTMVTWYLSLYAIIILSS